MATSSPAALPVRVAAATDIGRKRSQNQDAFASVPELGLFIVADGMGGHRGGEIASRIAVERISEEARTLIERIGPNPNVAMARETIAEAIRRANSSIFERSRQEPELRGMGTTTTALYFHREGTASGPIRVVIGHVGDSRCYFLRNGELWQLTRDHSLVQEKLRAGLITREAARVDTMKNVITRSVGFEETVDVETYEAPVRPGDRFLICSDGLSGLIDDDIIRDHLEKSRDGVALEQIVAEMIADANARGGDDNITSVVIEVL